MPGSRITRNQEELYMKSRQKGLTQEAAAARTGISTRSGRSIEHHGRKPNPRHWRTRPDPLTTVWDEHLVPLLEREPELTGLTLLEYLQDTFPDQYDQTVLRTLQRRVRHWKAVHGPEKDVIFRQAPQPGRQGLSDFTYFPVCITIAGEPLQHLLYQFRLAFSGWRYVLAIQGGESYAALAEGLQRALSRLGGCPQEHRTDSLSAAFNNKDDQLRTCYAALCDHYHMTATRNNKGISHENGAIEAPHGSLKRRLSQALKVRGSADFDSVDEYQQFIEHVVTRLNRRVRSGLAVEQALLQALPDYSFADYTEVAVRVTRSATIEVRRVLYTVPSKLIGERLHIHLHHDRLRVFLGTDLVVTLARVHARGQQRLRQVDYRHVIHALAAKPQAFRYSQLRDDLLPNDRYRQLWRTVDEQLAARDACKWMVGVLRLAADYDCERALMDYVEAVLAKGPVPTLKHLQARYLPQQPVVNVNVEQHDLEAYDQKRATARAVLLLLATPDVTVTEVRSHV